MAKLSITIFFLFFTLSFARTPLSQPENDIKLLLPLPESDSTTSTNQFDKETQQVDQEKQDILEPKTKNVKALPLTFVRLRPINRHFRLRSRHPIRLCHHHHFHNARYPKPRTHLDHRINSGKDRLLPLGENGDFERVMFHGGMHQVPEAWINFNSQDDDEQKMSSFIIRRDNHDYKFDKMKLENQFYDPLDDDEDEDDKISEMQHEDHHSFDKKKLEKHLHHHEEETEEENQTHKEENKKGGFMGHIRKFLDRYLE